MFKIIIFFVLRHTLNSYAINNLIRLYVQIKNKSFKNKNKNKKNK